MNLPNTLRIPWVRTLALLLLLFAACILLTASCRTVSVWRRQMAEAEIMRSAPLDYNPAPVRDSSPDTGAATGPGAVKLLLLGSPRTAPRTEWKWLSDVDLATLAIDFFRTRGMWSSALASGMLLSLDQFPLSARYDLISALFQHDCLGRIALETAAAIRTRSLPASGWAALPFPVRLAVL